MLNATCSSCGAAIVWALTEKGKAMPVDAKPVPLGNIDLVADNDPRQPPIAFVLTSKGTRQIPALRFQSHFVSCPDADKHRARR